MNEDRLNRKVFVWAMGKKNWTKHVKAFLETVNSENLLNLNSGYDPKEAVKTLDQVLTTYYNENWQNQLNRQQAIRGPGQNKLRTYRLFKHEPKCEQYVKIIMPKKYRSALAKFRAGVAPIRIETGRYENPPLPAEERICQFCDINEPETEEHVLIRCTQYNDIRNELMTALGIHDDSMSDNDKFFKYI